MYTVSNIFITVILIIVIYFCIYFFYCDKWAKLSVVEHYGSTDDFNNVSKHTDSENVISFKYSYKQYIFLPLISSTVLATKFIY